MGASWKTQFSVFSYQLSVWRGELMAGGPLLAFARSVQMKDYFHVDLHGYRQTVFSAGFEAPGANGFESLLVQTHSQGAHDLHFTRVAIRTNYEPQHN